MIVEYKNITLRQRNIIIHVDKQYKNTPFLDLQMERGIPTSSRHNHVEGVDLVFGIWYLVFGIWYLVLVVDIYLYTLYFVKYRNVCEYHITYKQ
jgi:hypothetical protein